MKTIRELAKEESKSLMVDVRELEDVLKARVEELRRATIIRGNLPSSGGKVAWVSDEGQARIALAKIEELVSLIGQEPVKPLPIAQLPVKTDSMQM